MQRIQNSSVTINGNCKQMCTEEVKDINHTENGVIELPPLPKGLEPLEHQLAGHKFGHRDNNHLYGILDCRDGTILKPVMSANKGERESYFYELINGRYVCNEYFPRHLQDTEAIKQLKHFTPQFLGLKTLDEHPDNATHRFSLPHIIDVKIGAKAWAPDSSDEKIARQKARCPHLDAIKFQVLGARYLDANDNQQKMRLNLRKLSPEDLQNKGLPDIFRGIPSKSRHFLLKAIHTKLCEIADWFTNQTSLSFHGSSVLIVFEGDLQFLSEQIEPKSPSELKAAMDSLLTVMMIDFVHVWEATTLDMNYLEGIESLKSYIKCLIDNIFPLSNI